MNLICFDCDNTLSAIEGVDELGRIRGPAVFSRIEAMTASAMNGSITLESVFAQRLEIIRPRAAEVAAVGRRYVETAEPTALATVRALAAAQWTPVIVSAGFRQAIRPLADLLGIARIEAVDLFFDAEGNYRGFDADFPSTRSGGKVEIIRRLREELRPSRVVMVGDGVSDLETAPVAELFVGFGRYATRERVRREAGAFITSLGELPALLRR